MVLPGVFDGYSARLVEFSGFAAAFASGAGISESRLGWADRGIMSLEDSLSACRAMARCTNLAIIADGDTGYGNAVNVHFATRAFEDAGMAGVMFEDQVWPKRCGHMAGKAVIPLDEAAGKIASAVAARRNPNFCIMARTDALAPEGRDAAIERLNAYAKAGADLLFADALRSREEIAAVAKAVDGPLVVNMGLGLRARSTTPLIPPKALERMGVKMVIYPRLLTAAALRGMINALHVFQTDVVEGNGTTDRPDLLASFDEINRLTGNAEIDALEERFAAVAEQPETTDKS